MHHTRALFAAAAVLLAIVLLLLANQTWAQEDTGDSDDTLVGGDEDLGGFEGDDVEEAMLAEPIPRLATFEAVEAFIDAKDALLGGGVVGVFGSVEKHKDEVREFEQLGQLLNGNGYRFAISVAQSAVMEKFGVKEDGWKVFVYPPPKYVSEAYGDKRRFRFGGNDIKSDAGKASLKTFLNKHYLPLVSRISPTVGNERVFMERRLPTFVVVAKFDEERDPKGTTYVVNRLRKIAQNYRDKMNFAILDDDDSEATIYFQKRYFYQEDEDASKAERVVGIKDNQNYYRMDSTFSVEASQAFVEKFFKGELKPSTVQEDMLDHPEDLSEEEQERNMNLEL